MSQAGAVWLDAESLAARHAVVEREFLLADFPRLADRLASAAGAVTARLELGPADGTPVANLTVRGRVPLICQRCLEPLAHEFESESRLAFVADWDARVPADCEAVAGDPTRVDLLALVEDELLLGLPASAKHAPGVGCKPAQAVAADVRRPLAELENLLRD